LVKILWCSHVQTRAGDTVAGGGRYQNTRPGPVDDSTYMAMDARRRREYSLTYFSYSALRSSVDIRPWASTRYCRSVMELAVGVGWRGG